MQMPIPDDWDGITCCRYSVTWPDSPKWQAILFGLISSPSRGRFWDITTGYIIGTQAAFRPFYEKNFNLPEVIMACDDGSAIASALQEIAIALSNQNNCSPTVVNVATGDNSISCYSNSNSGIQQIITLPDDQPWPIYGNGPIPQLPEDGFPDGYEDVDQYSVDKCKKANKMADDFIATLRNIGTITWVASALGTVTLGGALVGLITLPVAAIPVFLFILIGAIGINALLIELANQIEANEDELVCILFEADSVQEIYDGLQTLLTGLITVIDPPAGLATALLQIALHLMNADTLGVLFTSVGMEIYPDADCDCGGCDDPTGFTWNFEEGNGDWSWECLEGSCGADAEWGPSIGGLHPWIMNVTTSGSMHTKQRLRSPNGCWTGNNLQVDILSQNGGGGEIATGTIHYWDETEDTGTFTTSVPGLQTNFAVAIDTEKQVKWVQVEWDFTNSNPTFDYSTYLYNAIIHTV